MPKFKTCQNLVILGEFHGNGFRQQLPVFNYKDKVLEAIHTHRVVLVTGGTGCGKTTQVSGTERFVHE